MKNKLLYTCMGCGFHIFEEVFSECEICDICGFQDTHGGIFSPYKSPFLGGKKTLFDYQYDSLKKIPFEIKEWKKGKRIYKRNSSWKPINLEKLDITHDYFPKWKYEEFAEKYPKYTAHHKQLMEEAQKYNPDEKVHLGV